MDMPDHGEAVPDGYEIVTREGSHPVRFDLQLPDGTAFHLPDYGTVSEARAAAWAHYHGLWGP